MSASDAKRSFVQKFNWRGSIAGSVARVELVWTWGDLAEKVIAIDDPGL